MLITDSDGKTTAQVTKVTTDGKELDVDNFKTFYQYLMGCPTNEIYFTDPEGESYLTNNIRPQGRQKGRYGAL